MKNLQTFTSQIHINLAKEGSVEMYSADDIKCICKKYCNDSNWAVSFANAEFIFPNGTTPGVIITSIITCPLDVGISHSTELSKMIMREILLPNVKVVFADETVIIEREDL